MKVLVFGSGGQLGLEVVASLTECQTDVIAYSKADLDITDSELVRRTIKAEAPTVIVNAAAYTKVDAAEQETDLAWMINGKAVQELAHICCELPETLLIHLSTDYVFDGESSRALRETDPVNPLNVYGSSKLAGEESILSSNGLSAVVLRTSSVHGIGGANFVHTMSRLLREKAKVSVVDDQFTSPTYAPWLASVIRSIAVGREDFMGRRSLLHAANEGQCSWYEFAQAIVADLEPVYGRSNLAEIAPIPAEEFPRPAKRPRFSVLDCSRLDSLSQLPRPHWRETLKEHIALMLHHSQSSSQSSY